MATMGIRAKRTVLGGAAGALAALAFVPGVAAARGEPTITNPPSISGKAVSGEQLTAVGATWQSNRPTEATFRWVRCADSGSWSDCSLIDGGDGASYTLTDADVGQRVLVWLRVTNDRGSADTISKPTAAVAKKPTPPPPPPPPPKPKPTPPPAPSPQPTTPPATDIVPPDITTPTTTTGGVAGQNADALRWLSPFPVVRIKGWLTRTGARVTMLTVRAPRGARIAVRCTGPGCPRKRYARMTRLVHLKPYQRLLRGNLKLEISVTRRGFVGKRTIITLRRGKAPARRDLCLYPGVSRARSCKAA